MIDTPAAAWCGPSLGVDRSLEADGTGCIAGALTEEEFRAALAGAGLVDTEIRPAHLVHAHASAAIARARKPER